MKTVQVGVFPGRIDSYVVEDGATVADALTIAGLSQGAEQDIKMDGEVVDATTAIGGGSLILLTKRIKGARN